MSHIVVIGYGMVGSRFVEDLTAADHAGEHLVTVLGDEACEPYNRVLLSDVVAGTRGLSAIALPAPDHPRVGADPPPQRCRLVHHRPRAAGAGPGHRV